MFTYNERDLHRMPTPAKTHLPVKQFIADSNILDDNNSSKDNEVRPLSNIIYVQDRSSSPKADVALLRLPAPGLRGTFSRAYTLLTKLVSHIGWDELLKTRSAVFVMEEEYRMQKAQADIRAIDGEKEDTNGNGVVIYEDGSVRDSGVGGISLDTGADDDASTRGVSGPPSAGLQSPELASPAIPTIKISTESDREREQEGIDAVLDSGAIANGNGNGSPNLAQSETETLVEKPQQAAANDEGDGVGGGGAGETAGVQEGFSFSNKRLCERWLDNLFMVLYEVSRSFPSLLFFVLSPTRYLHVLTRKRPRTSGFGRSSALRWRTSRHSTLPTARPVRNGKFSATWACGYITRRNPKRPINDAWTLSSRLKRG